MFHESLRSARFRGAALATVLCALVFGAVLPAPAQADARYPVAWTKIGIYPQSAPSMGSGQIGKALPDGAVVTIVCEQRGQSVSNGLNTTDIWERLDTGAWLPNAFIKTGVDGWTPGVPRCDELAKKAPANTQDRSADRAEVEKATRSVCGDYVASFKWIKRDGVESLSVVPTDCGRLTAFVNKQASFDELYHKVRANWADNVYWSMHNQWTCHADWAPPYLKNEWNLEQVRPNVGYWNTVFKGCNP